MEQEQKANALGVESAVSPLSHCGADTGYVGSVPQLEGMMSPVLPSGCGCCSVMPVM